MNLAVVIVTYESGAHIGTTLRALNEQLRDGDELVIVDNASKDGTAAAVREAAPSAQLLEQRDNLGFAGGCNLGARAAHAPLLLFLNPDAVPDEGCIDALRATAESRRDWAAWQPLVTMNGGSTINTSGGITHFLGMGWAGRCGEPVDGRPLGADRGVVRLRRRAVRPARGVGGARGLRRALLHVRRGSRPGPPYLA